ncbi:MAG: head-tail connector protein [Thalassobaculum sp.]
MTLIGLDWRLDVATPPATTPVALDATLYRHLRLDASGSPLSHVDDDLIEAELAAARDQCEQVETGRTLITTTYDLWLSDWPCGRTIDIPRPPLQSVTSITYLDGTSEQTLSTDAYRVHTPSGPTAMPGQIELKPANDWPTLGDDRWPVVIRFIAGYGATPADVPFGIRSWIMLLVGTMYANRDSEIVGTIRSDMKFADRLLDPFRLYSVF